MKWLVIPLLAVALPTAAQINTVPISNNSASTAIEIKGEAMFAESIESSASCADLHESRCLVVSILDEFSCRNVSGKPILAVVATLRYMSSHGSVVENYTLVDTTRWISLAMQGQVAICRPSQLVVNSEEAPEFV